MMMGKITSMERSEKQSAAPYSNPVLYYSSYD